MLITMNKRSFMLGTAATLAAPAAMAAASCRPALDGRSGRLDWQAYLGERFELEDEQGARAMVRLASIGTAPARRGCEQFSLVFEAPQGEPAPPAGLYRLEHADGHATALYMSAGLRADFNLLRSG
ncbi:DUF6916 family protein [Paucibacter soli]|uniref:DUF6916 family protein n=1 Tax=Paucibacter soli TaxID=3133433 RepID=UPI0030A0CCDE